MLFKKMQDRQIYAPIAGRIIPLEDINDSTFSSGIMGPGLGIDPDGTCIYSPYNGEITMIFPTGHAIGITRNDKLEILIHIGIDTVNLKGEGFRVLVKDHTMVKQGDRLIEFDPQVIRAHKLDPVVIMIFTNSKDYDITIDHQNSETADKEVIAHAERKR